MLTRTRVRCKPAVKRQQVRFAATEAPKQQWAPRADFQDNETRERIRAFIMQQKSAEFNKTNLRSDLRVLIVGSDVPALTTAIALAKNGQKPVVLDTSPNPFDNSIEYATMLPMNGMRVFRELGLEQVVKRLGYPITAYSRMSEFGLPYGGIPYSDLASIHGISTMGVHYKTLSNALEKVLHEMKVEVRRRGRIVSMSQKEPTIKSTLTVEEIEKSAYVSVQTESMTSMMSGIVKKDEQFDVVLISEGPFSRSRELVWPKQTKIAPIATRFDAIIERPTQVPIGVSVDFWGSMKRCGFFPISESQLYTYGFVAVVDKQEVPQQATLSSDAFLSHFHGTRGVWMDVQKEIANKGSCNRTFAWRSFPEEWSSNRVALLGSSAHSIPEPAARGHDLAAGLEEALYFGKFLPLPYLPLDAVMEKYQERPQLVSNLYRSTMGDMGLALEKMGPYRRILASLIGRVYFHTQHKLTKEENERVGFDKGRAEELASPNAVHDYQTLMPPSSMRR